MKIAIIEDDSCQALLYSDTLQDDGHYTFVFDKPSRFKEMKIDGLELIISDGQMRGETISDSIKARDELYPRVPIICVSGNPDTINIMRDLGYAALLKPFRMKELKLEIKKYGGIQ